MNKELEILRASIVKVAQMLTGQGLKVTQRGMDAYVESDRTGKPVRVNIPYLPDNASEDLIVAIQGFLDHEIAHIFFTDFRRYKAVSDKVDTSTKNLLNMIEDSFIEREMGRKFPGSAFNLQLLHEFFVEKITKPALDKVSGNIAHEFGVMMPVIIRAWAGQETFKRFLNETGFLKHPAIAGLVDKIPPALVAKIPKIKTTEDSIAIALELAKILSDGGGSSPENSGEDEGEGSPGDKKSSGTTKKPTKSDSEEKGSEKGKAAPADPDPEDDDADPDEGGKDSDEGDGLDDEGDGENDDESGDEGDGLDDEGDEGGEGDEGDEGDEGGEGDEGDEGGEGGGNAGGTYGAGDDADNDDGKESGQALRGDTELTGNSAFSSLSEIEETDFEKALSSTLSKAAIAAASTAEYSIYSNEWDTIEEYPVSPTLDPANLTKIDDQVGHMIGKMQKDIERMMAARSLSVRVPGYRSGRLHTAALHRLTTGDDRVFRRKFEMQSKDTAVCLLIDNSGSMNGGRYGHDSKFAVAMKAGYALSQTLERVGIKNECLGFTTGNMPNELHSLYYKGGMVSSDGRKIPITRFEPLYMPIFKKFGETFSSLVRQRFASAVFSRTKPLSNNVDGECVALAAKRLLQRPEKRKVLIVLSDGQPACASGNMYALQQHLKKTVEEVTAAGVETIGIGIMDDSVRTYYPRYMTLNNVEDLPARVMGELRRILSA